MPSERNSARERAPAANAPDLSERRGVLFDLMGTLAIMDRHAYAAKQCELARCLGVSQRKFRHAWAISRTPVNRGEIQTVEQRITFVAEKLGVTLCDRNLVRLADIERRIWRDHVRLDDETIPVLCELQARSVSSGVVSNGGESMLGIDATLGLRAYCSVFILSSQVGVAKPSPKIYRCALSQLGIRPTHCLFVGDGADRELEGARAAGMRAVKLRRPDLPHASAEDQSKSWDYEVEHLSDILPLVSHTDT